MIVGRVASVWRFPVKSTGGESLPRAMVDDRGVEGDRAWAVYTEQARIGSGKSTRRFARIDGLLSLRSWLDGATPVLALPDGGRARAGEPGTDEWLSAHLRRTVQVRRESAVPHHDESPVHLVTSASLRRLAVLLGRPVDPLRSRANLVLDVAGTGFVEDGWRGRRLRVGADVVLALGDGMPRCVMVDEAQPGLPRDGDVLRALAAWHDLELGLQASVAAGGVVTVDDPVVLE